MKMYMKRKNDIMRQMNNDALYISKMPEIIFVLQVMKIKLSLKGVH